MPGPLSLLARLRRWVSPASRSIARRPLLLEILEDRLTPAFDLSIGLDPTVNVTTTTDNNFGVRTFTANATGAKLAVADVKAALVAGFSVFVRNGTAGNEAGNFTWTSGDLDTDGISSSFQFLDLEADPSSTTGSMTVSIDVLDSNLARKDSVIFELLPAVSGSVDMTGSDLTAVSTLFVNGNSNPVILGNFQLTNLMSAIGSTITLSGATTEADFGQSYMGDVVLPGDRTLTSAFGAIEITGSVDGDTGDGADTLAINAPQQFVSLVGNVGDGAQIADLDVLSRAITLEGDVTLTSGISTQMSLRGDLSTSGASVFTLNTASGSSVLFEGDVDLGGNLIVTLPAATDVVFIQDGIFAADDFDVLTNGVVEIGDGTDRAAYEGAGSLSAAAVEVKAQASIVPGGRAAGSLEIIVTGGVTFEAGSILDVTLQEPNELTVIGTVDLGTNVAFLKGFANLPNAGPHTILTATALTGTFANTTGEIILGGDAVTVAYDATTVKLTQVAADPNTVTGLTSNGDKYSITKTGPGELVVIDVPGDPGIEGIAIRNSTAATTLKIVITANGGPGIETVEMLGIGGAIGTISASTTNFSGPVQVSGALRSLIGRDLTGELQAGGNLMQSTTITGRIFDAELEVSAKVALLSFNEYDGGSIQAPVITRLVSKANPAAGLRGDFSTDLDLDAGNFLLTALGSANIAGDVLNSTWDVQGKLGALTVKGNATGWTLGETGAAGEHPDALGAITSLTVTGAVTNSAVNSFGRINTITASSWVNTPLKALTVGTWKLLRNTALGLSGNMTGSTITLLGNLFNPNQNQVVLTTFSAAGTVQSSTFNVTGNVTSFVVGKFLSSNLYVGYVPATTLDVPGTFTGTFKIGTFMTTATPVAPGVPDPATDAFMDSEVVSARVGTVRLTGVTVNNGGTKFGFRVAFGAGNVGSFQIATNPFTKGVNYKPSANGAVTPAVAGQVDFGFYV